MSRKVLDHYNMRAVISHVPDLYNKQDQLLSKEPSIVLSWKSTVATQGLCLHPLQIGCSGTLASCLSEGIGEARMEEIFRKKHFIS